ncbi:Benzoyl-CoA reductase subunit B [Sporomusa silvacetica DSM 10669]|uniref:Benzoyl-CoA reductase subunit B n=1 Tax=Sporomusa silvacetica DSM 10669 TaxID=1123289 RepID=A0ABZ3IKP7_9FIRM|nr:2-hydroxyacyl-CoA dehydratase family protein [Sporomusa silvacetica]OZC13443.1 R-phenyllactate dehydratase subunit alpha precursor [Sporomusa silvacetica DSM 10669]
MNEQKNLFKELSDASESIVEHARKKYPDRLWMFEVQKVYWQSVYQAHEKGLKLILHGPNMPPELIYAFGAVPFLLDCVPTRIASSKEGVARYVDIAEKYVPSSLCGLDKTDIGAILSGDIEKPDAIIYASAPCDSTRVAYPAIADHLGVPSYCIDTPYKKDERGFAYIAEEMRGAVAFLEEVTGNKLDWNRMAEVIGHSNKAYELLGKIAELRQNIPCPLPGRLLVLNELFGAMVGSPEIIDFLEAQYKIGKEAADKKEGCLEGEEKFRIMWLQNMIWSNVGILDWLEKEYGAVVIMDAFGYQASYLINDPWNEDEVFIGLAKRMLGAPMTHGASGPVEPWMELVERAITDYKCNVSFFAGHVGCKHTWAAGKLIKDMVYNKFGMSTLTFDLDAVDRRYKGEDAIKETIKEYMDTLIESKGAK